MWIREAASPRPGSARGSAPVPAGPGDRAVRRAWWALALYPVSFVAAFVTGEGLLSLLADDPADPGFWEVLAAGTPALLVFVLPGILAVILGRRAIGLGRRDGWVPAVVGGAVGVGFVGLNVASYLVGLVVG